MRLAPASYLSALVMMQGGRTTKGDAPLLMVATLAAIATLSVISHRVVSVRDENVRHAKLVGKHS